MAVGVSTAKGGETTEGSSIASNEATVGVSTAKGGETTEGSSIANNEATVGVSMTLELFEITYSHSFYTVSTVIM